MQCLLLYAVSATFHYPEEEYEEFASCVGEVSKNIFRAREDLIVLFPIISDTTDSYGTCMTQVNAAAKKSSHCSIENISVALFHYTEHSCHAHTEYKSITRAEKIHDFILSELHKLSKWSIVLPPNDRHHSYLYSDIESYILIFYFENNNPEGLIDQFHLARKSMMFNEFNEKGTFLLVITGDIIPEKFLTRLKGYSDIFLDTVVTIHRNSLRGKIAVDVQVREYSPFLMKVYTFITFCTKYGRFEHGSDLDVFNRSNKLFEKTDYCTGPDVTDEIYVHDKSYEVLNYADKKISKILQDNLLTNIIDCKPDINETVQVTNSFLHGYVDIKQYPHIYTMEFRFLVHLADKYPRWNSIFRVFSITTWITIFVSLFICSVVFPLISSSKYINKEKPLKRSPFYPLNLWGVLLGGGFNEFSEDVKTRMLIFSWIVFAICINTIFQTFVTSYLVDPGFQYQVKTVQEATKKSFDIFIPPTVSYAKLLQDNSYITNSFEDALLSVVDSPNTIFLVSKEIFVHNYKKLCKNNPPTFYMLEDTIHINVYYEFLNNLDVLTELYTVMRRFAESGIPDKLLRDLSDPKGTQEGIYQPTALQDEYESLSVIHLQSLFLIYLLGGIMSFIAFLIEILIFHRLSIFMRKC